MSWSLICLAVRTILIVPINSVPQHKAQWPRMIENCWGLEKIMFKVLSERLPHSENSVLQYHSCYVITTIIMSYAQQLPQMSDHFQDLGSTVRTDWGRGGYGRLRSSVSLGPVPCALPSLPISPRQSLVSTQIAICCDLKLQTVNVDSPNPADW